VSPIPHVPQENKQTTRAQRTEDASLISKKAWDIAKAPASMLPVYLLLFYLIPNSPSIITIFMIGYFVYNPFASIFNMNNAFKSVAEQINPNTIIMCKILFVTLNIVSVALMTWKLSKLDLLPTTADWVLLYSKAPVPTEFSSGRVIA